MSIVARQNEFYTIPEVAKKLKVSPSTVWRWVKAKKLLAYRVGEKTVRVRESDVVKLLQPLHVSLEKARCGKSRGDLVIRIAALHEAILERRNGRLLPDSAGDLAVLREERDG
ncbi:MAG: DNA-binding protein [Peptococcaceae bacterium]|nr:MAG: DNA-binding protein [Peptococcaceae bacterium]